MGTPVTPGSARARSTGDRRGNAADRCPPPGTPCGWIDARTRPDLKRAAPATVIALLSYALRQRLGGIGRGEPANIDAFGVTAEVPAGYLTLAVTVLAVIFVVAGLIASRAAARELARVAQSRGGLAAASSIRLICHLLGFVSPAWGCWPCCRWTSAGCSSAGR